MNKKTKGKTTMPKSSFKSEAKRSTKVQFQHFFLFAALVIAFFFFLQYSFIPWGVAKFVVPLFQPSGEKLEKMAFVKLPGLIWVSATQDKAAELSGIKSLDAVQLKDYINREYIFDFTFVERNMETHGYVKGATEFYAKSEVLGEHPIYLEPWIGFWILALVLAVVLSIFVTILLPPGIGLMAMLFDRQIENTKIKIRLQTGFPDEIVDLLTMPDHLFADKEPADVERAFRTVWDRTTTDEVSSSKNALNFDDVFDDNIDVVKFRNNDLYGRMREFFSDFLVKEIVDTKNGLLWRRNHFQILKGTTLYMTHHFTEKYSNNVTGLAYGGAAFLIVAVGIRGLKFIPATRPSFILLAIFLEFSMLALLAITLIFTEEEERMDRMLKKMEDANRSQLEALRVQQHDIRILANALVGKTEEMVKARVETAISEYMKSEDNIKRIVGEEIGQKITKALKGAFVDEDTRR